MEWWFDKGGRNLLSGIVDDVDNPALIGDDYIAEFLTKIPEARESYLRLKGTMTAAEIARIETLYPHALMMSTQTDPINYSDMIQSRHNQAGVRTAGVHGGTRMQRGSG